MGASLAAAAHNYYKTLNKGGLAMPTTEGEQVDNAVQREELERSLHKIVNAHGTRSFHYRQSTPMMNELVKFVEAYAATQADKALIEELEKLGLEYYERRRRMSNPFPEFKDLPMPTLADGTPVKFGKVSPRSHAVGRDSMDGTMTSQLSEAIEDIFAKYAAYEEACRRFTKNSINQGNPEDYGLNAQQAKAALTAHIKTVCEEVIGADEVDETGINALTQYGLRIENRNQLRAEQRTRLQSLTKEEEKE